MNARTMSRNVAVIGFGYWGKNLIRNFHELGVLHSICDSDLSRAEETNSRYANVRFTNDYLQILADDQIRAIVIATPAATHYELARAALEAGKDVFVEKPLALKVAHASELVKLAASRQRILMVGHILQYHPAVIRLKELVQSGELGRIEYLYSNRLNIGKFRAEEDILWSFAPHDISVILSLLNEQPVHVSCQGGDYLSKDVADVTMSQFVFASGVRAHIFVSWLNPFKEQRLVVVGSEKMAVMDDGKTDKLVIYPHRVTWVNRIPNAVKADAVVIPIDATEPLRAECEHFLQCIDNRAEPITNGQEGIRVLKVLESCQQSLAKHRAAIELIPVNSGGTADTSTSKQHSFFAHDTASIDSGCQIGAESSIWHYAHIMERAIIGEKCSIGQNCFVAPDVVIGNNVKIQNNVSVYTGTIIEDDVFLGPSCVLTNVSNPRAQVNRRSIYERTVIRRGVTVGANATIVCGIEIGRYAFIAAGAVVTKTVPQYALMMGNPAKQVAWMSRHGHRLPEADDKGVMTCPESGLRYAKFAKDALRCLDLDEETALPSPSTKGEKSYRSFKALTTSEIRMEHP